MRLRNSLFETLILSLLMLTANAYAGEERSSLDWLKMVVSATHKTDYSGVFVYQHDNRVETSRITHVVEPDSEYEKLESLDGPKSIIIRHHGQVWCSINNRMEQVDSRQGRKNFPSLYPDQMSVLSENYRIKVEKVERVADHNAQVILIQPKDNLRYTHKIWIHTDSGLLLKAAVLGDKNKLVEQYAFTQLQIGGKIDRSWIDEIQRNSNSSASSQYLSQDDSVDLKNSDHPNSLNKSKGGTPVKSGWMVNAVPKGFKKNLEIQRNMRGKYSPVTQLVFSDGLSAISVFIEPADGDEEDSEGLSSRGGVHLYRKVVDNNLFTVVGEVPPHTVMQVLESVRRRGK